MAVLATMAGMYAGHAIGYCQDGTASCCLPAMAGHLLTQLQGSWLRLQPQGRFVSLTLEDSGGPATLELGDGHDGTQGLDEANES